MKNHPHAAEPNLALGLVYLLIFVAAFVALMLAVSTTWVGVFPLAGALVLAKRKWPAIPVALYFNSRRAVLPVAAYAAGACAQVAFRPTLAAALAGGLGAAVMVSIVIAILDRKIMKSLFDLVPAAQRPELEAFLAGATPTPGAGGQQADLSMFDQATVAGTLKQHVIGQDAIVGEVVKTTFRRAELVRPNKPLATFLLVGPTGVGKSELAKALAKVLFNGRIINLPLNQMKSAEDVWAIVGPPPGYQDSERGGKLCRDLARLGTGVVVLDEIEKAHPDVLQALMRLLDEGQLTEQSTGAVYSARGFLIIGTSNAAAGEIGAIAQAEPDLDARAAKVRQALYDSGFPPEVVSRFDAVLPFPPLDRKAVAQIVCLMAERHAAAAGVELVSVDGALLMDLIRSQEKGADAGMRNLDRAVERALLDGFLAARKSGATRAAVRVVDGRVEVKAADIVAASGGARA